MEIEGTLPYEVLVLVCTNDRGPGARISCAGEGRCGARLRDRLKDAATARGWKGRVRVSASGCLDVCEQGPTVFIVPRSGASRRISAAAESDAEAILDSLFSLGG